MTLDEELKNNLRYDCDTGLLWWKKRKSGRRFSKPVGSTGNSNGYVQICFRFNGKDHMLQGHRVAWLLHYGVWPVLKVDHIDRNRTNNKIVNLRQVTDLENAWNISLRVDNKTGYKGVNAYKDTGKFMATLQKDGKQLFLGYYKTAELAGEAYDKAVEHHRDAHATKSNV